MSQQNTQTLETYQAKFSNYINGTPSVTTIDEFQGKWLQSILEGLPSDAKIFEIGSAFGRDADFIKSLGYKNIEVTDAFDAAVEILKEKGYAARKFNVLSDEFESKFDTILALAVFLHFSEVDFIKALGKVRDALKPDGRFVFCLKQGSGEEWSEEKMEAPRYFHYWTFDELESIIAACGMKFIDKRISPDEKWIYGVCVRTEE